MFHAKTGARVSITLAPATGAGVLREMRTAKLAAGRARHETIVQAAFSPSNTLQQHDATLALMSNPVVFPKVVDVLGCNIRVYHSHFNFTPGREEKAGTATAVGCSSDGPPADYSMHPTFGFR